ncbi:MAG: PIN domain-containing protein [Chloroflexota bacterium]|nr:PIN domain-containing protein [Chloroflexota bacterium]
MRTAVDGRALASSRVAVVEVAKAVARVDPEADPYATFARLAFLELDAEVATMAAATGGTVLRALDAIHIASALRLGADLEAFITYDARQASAARELGLPVESPGQVGQ